MAQLCTRTAPPGGASCCGSRRRTLLAGFGAVVATHPLLGNAAWASDEPVEFVDDKRRFGLQVPAEWQLKDKAGADAYFEVGKKYSSVGVTVLPVRVASLEQFGSEADVGKRLVDAEKAKDGTLSVDLQVQESRRLPDGQLAYDFEYVVESTRGTNRFFTTVSISKSKLYIANGKFRCEKGESCEGGDFPGMAAMRNAVKSLRVLS